MPENSTIYAYNIMTNRLDSYVFSETNNQRLEKLRRVDNSRAQTI